MRATRFRTVSCASWFGRSAAGNGRVALALALRLQRGDIAVCLLAAELLEQLCGVLEH